MSGYCLVGFASRAASRGTRASHHLAAMQACIASLRRPPPKTRASRHVLICRATGSRTQRLIVPNDACCRYTIARLLLYTVRFWLKILAHFHRLKPLVSAFTASLGPKTPMPRISRSAMDLPAIMVSSFSSSISSIISRT